MRGKGEEVEIVEIEAESRPDEMQGVAGLGDGGEGCGGWWWAVGMSGSEFVVDGFLSSFRGTGLSIPALMI